VSAICLILYVAAATVSPVFTLPNRILVAVENVAGAVPPSMCTSRRWVHQFLSYVAYEAGTIRAAGFAILRRLCFGDLRLAEFGEVDFALRRLKGFSCET